MSDLRTRCIEAIAKTLYELRYPNTTAKWATVSEFYKERFFRLAEAALDALLEELEAHKPADWNTDGTNWWSWTTNVDSLLSLLRRAESSEARSASGRTPFDPEGWGMSRQQLVEALRQFDEQRTTDRGSLLLAAARAVAEGTEAWWCENHYSAEAMESAQCWRGTIAEDLGYVSPCQMVKVLIVKEEP